MVSFENSRMTCNRDRSKQSANNRLSVIFGAVLIFSMSWSSFAISAMDARTSGVHAVPGKNGYLDQVGQIAELWQTQISGGSILEITADAIYSLIDSGGDTHYLAAIDATTGQQRWMVRSDYLNRFEVVDDTILAANHVLGTVYAVDAATGQQRWTYSVEGDFFYPTVVGQMVYVENLSANQLSAIDLDTGQLEWVFDGNWRIIDDMIYGTSDGVLSVIDATTGELHWDAFTGGSISTARDGVIYLDDRSTGTLTAVDEATGQLKWVTYIGGRVTLRSLHDGVGFVRGENADLYAVDISSGEVLWTSPIDIDDSNDYVTDVFDGTAYAFGDKLYAIDVSTGQRLWTSPFGSDWNHTRISGGMVYTIEPEETTGGSAATPPARNNDILYALDATTGQEVWSFPIGSRYSFIDRIVGGLIYAKNGDDTLFAIDTATGEVQWSVPTSYPISYDALDDGIVYLGSGDTVHAIDAVSGEPHWSFQANDTITWPLEVIDGMVYFATAAETLYSVGNPEQATASAEATAAAVALEQRWDTYLHTDLPDAFTENVSALPGMSVSPLDMSPRLDANIIPAGYERIVAFPVEITGGTSSAWTALAIYQSTEDADTALTVMSGGLARSGWEVQETNDLRHDHACLTLTHTESSEALCYMTRDDALIISYSSVGVLSPDAALLNVIDLTQAMDTSCVQVERPD